MRLGAGPRVDSGGITDRRLAARTDIPQLNPFLEQNLQTSINGPSSLSTGGKTSQTFIIHVNDGGKLNMASMQAANATANSPDRLEPTASPIQTQPPHATKQNDAHQKLPANDLRRSLASRRAKLRFPPLQLSSTTAPANLAAPEQDPHPPATIV